MLPPDGWRLEAGLYNSGGVLHSVDLSDVGMIQRDECFGFTVEARQPVSSLRKPRRENFDPYFAIELDIPARDAPSPMPPAPSGARTSYGPRRVPAASCME